MINLPNPFDSVSPGDGLSSLPSGESGPSVTLDLAPGESRFVLDADAFMAEIEPPLRADELVDVLAVLAGH